MVFMAIPKQKRPHAADPAVTDESILNYSNGTPATLQLQTPITADSFYKFLQPFLTKYHPTFESNIQVLMSLRGI